MNKPVAAVALILVSELAFGGIPIPAERNLVRNGGFEEGSEGWRMPSAGHYRIESGVGRGGSAALVFDCDAVPPFSFPRQWISGVRAGRAYRFGGWMKVERLTQTVKDLKYMISFDWYAADRRLAGQRAFEVVDNAVGDTGGWIRFEGTSRYLEPEIARAELLVLGGRGAYGRILFDDFWMEELPYEPVGHLVTSAYRDTAADGRVRLVVELRVNLGETPLETLVPEFVYVGADGEKRRVKPDRFDATSAEVELDVASLAVGTVPLGFELKDRTGKSLGRRAIRFTHEERHVARKVEIDAHGRCLVDGKPFFPYGMYTKPMTQEELDVYCEAPFNALENYTLLDTPQLDMIHAKGLKLLYCIGAYYYNYGHNPKRFKDDADAAAFVTGVIEKHRDHPALLGWYCCDEMPISFIPTIEERYRLVKRLDPEHPVWIVLDRPQNVRRYIRCFDAIGSDPYPIGAIGADCNRTEMTGEWTATTKEQTFGLKPVWEVPQAMNWGWYRTPDPEREYRYPTEQELRNMTWQSVAAGANGLIYYCFHTMRRLLPGDGYKAEWKKVLAVSREFVPFFDVFLSVDPHDGLAGAPKGVFTRNWNFRGEEWALVVNGTNAPKDVALALGRRYVSASAAFGDALRLDGKTLSGVLPPLGISFMKLKRER